ncbi:MAG TPA: glutamate mutase [Firmicutes bacterium]|nr:glutamate mutase [Bacillota bacterium]
MAQKEIAVLDVGSTYTKCVALLDSEQGYSVLGQCNAPTTIEDITIGVEEAFREIAKQLGRREFRPAEIRACSSAAGGLRMVAMGFMSRVTAKAAKEAAMTAGARVLEVLSDADAPDMKVEILREISPDIILLAGGTDGGQEDSLVSDARLIAKSGVRAAVIIAGNVRAQDGAIAALQGSLARAIPVANIMPTIHELNLRPAREAIHREFIKEIVRAPGLRKLLEIVSDREVIPTPGAVLMGAELLSLGTPRNKGLQEIVVLDIGGATTDVHSVLPKLAGLPIEERGLIITDAKQVLYRTVEGNLGLRVSARGIFDAAGPVKVLERAGLAGKMSESTALEFGAKLEKEHSYTPQNPAEKALEKGMAVTALEIAIRRHAGHVAIEVDPVMGIIPGMPIGRDLRDVRKVIAVGGVFQHMPEEEGIDLVRRAFANPGPSLLPEKFDVAIDRDYILYAAGILSKVRPDAAFQFAAGRLHFR